MACQIEINPQAFGDWEEVARVTKLAPLDDKGKSLRIPAFALGVSLKARFIAVKVTSIAAKNTWVAGGYIAQAYAFPGISMILDSQYLKLNSVNLVELKENENYNCDLVFYPRSYFEDVEVRVWKYIGEEVSFLETVLTDIQDTVNNGNTGGNVDLSEIITKLDTLSTNLDDSYLDLTDDLSDLVAQLTIIQDSLGSIDTDVLTQLGQLDAGIFTLFEALKNLISESEATQLEQSLRTRLNLEDEFL